MADVPMRGGVAGTYLQTVSYAYGASSGPGSAWFGPGLPMAPTAPPDVVGRQFDYPVGYNLNTRPRTYEPIGFRDLRALADGYDLLRLAIETRKDQLSRMSWSIKSRDAEAKDKDDPRVKALTAFFQRPDGEHGWQDWLRPVLEDLFVIDAPALYLRRDRGGRLFELVQLDGATIKPIIDDWGRTPRPYSLGGVDTYPPAYQQVLKGLPAVDYSTRDLLYRPRNRRVHTPYGFSPVEQIVTTVNIALRRQLSTLSYFTEGNIPDAIAQLPKEWTPDQIVTFQQHWDAYFSGDLGRRRRVKFVPGAGSNFIHETRQQDLKGEFDEWLAKLICFAFSLSPQALIRQMNRASADTQKELAEEEGLAPVLLWLKALFDDVIRFEFGADDLQFEWNDDDEVDKAEQLATLTGYLRVGALTINEVRDAIGKDPLPDPEASQAMIIGSTASPLGAFQQQQEQAAANARLMAEAQTRQPVSAVGGDGRPVPALAASVAKPDDAEKVAKADVSAEARDDRGRWTAGGSATGAKDHNAEDLATAKEAAFGVAKGVALVAAASLAVVLAPEVGAVAVVASAATYAADAAFYDAGYKSAKVILRHMGVDTADIDERVKGLVGLGKAGAAHKLDDTLRTMLREVTNHVRDEMLAHVEGRHADATNLAEVVAAIKVSCEAYKEKLASLGKVYRLGKRRLGAAWRSPEPIPLTRPGVAKAFNIDEARDDAGRWSRQAMSDHRKTILAKGRGNGKEWLGAIDHAAQKVYPVYGSGLNDFVKLSDELLARLAKGGEDITVQHNHPKGSSFSAQDLGMAAHFRLAHLIVHTHDGSDFRVSVPAPISGNEIIAHFRKAERVLQGSAPPPGVLYDVSAANFNHVVHLILSSKGVIDYHADFSPEHPATLGNMPAVLKSFALRIAKKVRL